MVKPPAPVQSEIVQLLRALRMWIALSRPLLLRSLSVPQGKGGSGMNLGELRLELIQCRPQCRALTLYTHHGISGPLLHTKHIETPRTTTVAIMVTSIGVRVDLMVRRRSLQGAPLSPTRPTMEGPAPPSLRIVAPTLRPTPIHRHHLLCRIRSQHDLLRRRPKAQSITALPIIMPALLSILRCRRGKRCRGCLNTLTPPIL
jgi:hypothetical protein